MKRSTHGTRARLDRRRFFSDALGPTAALAAVASVAPAASARPARAGASGARQTARQAAAAIPAAGAWIEIDAAAVASNLSAVKGRHENIYHR